MATWNMIGTTSFDEANTGIIANLLSGYVTTVTSSEVTVLGNGAFAGWEVDIFPSFSFTATTNPDGTAGFIGNIDHINIYNAENVLIATITDIPAGVAYTALNATDPLSTGFYDTVIGTTGSDTIHAIEGQFVNSGAGNDILVGSEGSDGLFGNAGIDSLSGGGGDDLLAVNAGDTANGGSGNDYIYFIGAGGVTTIDGGADSDIIDFSTYATAGIHVTLGLAPTGSDYITATHVEAAIGSYYNDTILGSNDDDIIAGLDGNDIIKGGAGDDLIDGGNGNDTIDGGDGFDEVDYSAATTGVTVNLASGTASGFGSDTLTGVEKIDGTNYSDNLTGDDSNNSLLGMGGNDVMHGGAGNDIIDGGSGNDIIDGGAGADAMTGDGGDIFYVDDIGDIVAEGNDGSITGQEFSSVSLVSAANIYALHVTGSDNISATAMAGTAGVNLYGNDGNNILTGNDGVNTLSGGAGDDTMIGGGGNDYYSVDDAGDKVVETASGGDRDYVFATISYVLADNIENAAIFGTDALNLTGNASDNSLQGNDGNNVLDGSAGNDTLTGGLGDDTFIVDSTGDQVSDSGGNDTIRSSVSLTLGTGIENLVLTGSADLYGNGNDLSNMLTGNSGDNWLVGGGGADTMTGGDGNDTYIVDTATDSVVENAGEGTDTVMAVASYSLGANVENLTLMGTAAINGTGNALANSLIGNDGGNSLSGGDGNDVIDGGKGADAMDGGAGNDTYYVDNAGDVTAELAAGGNDQVFTSVTYTIGGNVERLTLTGSANIMGAGNSQNNVIIGNSGNNRLNGGAGNDVLSGGLGNDALDGGKGADTMKGGVGDDRYYVENTGDVITEFSNQGHDTVITTLNYALGANVEDLTQVGTHDYYASGNALDNHLTGNIGNNLFHGGNGNDVIDGGKGADKMYGGMGDDIFYVDNTGDVVVEYTGQGTDTVVSTIDYTLSGAVENLTLSGTGNISGTGTKFDNILTGNAGDNTLKGLAGNDTLDGGGGTDALYGGAGNDVYIVDSAGDTVYEASAGGFDTGGVDTVRSSVSYTLSNFVETLVLTGTADNGTGNTLDNFLVGNGRDNILDGATGQDEMHGGAGNDTYIVDNAGDHADEFTVAGVDDGGVDTVIASVDFSLGDYVENLVLTGQAHTGTGNDLDNVVTGGNGNDALNGLGGNDVLNGGTGDDTLDGGLGVNDLYGNDGNDTYIVNSTDDHVHETAAGGTDTVVTSLYTYTLDANVENLTMVGDASFATGNSLDNVMTGSDNGDYIDGGAGADTLYGGVGDETYYVDNAGDVIVEKAGEGEDRVFSTVTYTLAANVDNLILKGSDNLNGTGNADHNIIVGNDGNNVINGKGGYDYVGGGLGADTFVFSADSKGGEIVDFAASENDMIDLTAFHDLKATATYSQDVNYSQITIHLDNGVVIVVDGALHSNDFQSHIIW